MLANFISCGKKVPRDLIWTSAAWTNECSSVERRSRQEKARVTPTVVNVPNSLIRISKASLRMCERSDARGWNESLLCRGKFKKKGPTVGVDV